MSKQTELAQVADTITVNSGNVGIGTSSPSEQINLVGSGGTSKIRFDGDSSNLQNNFIGITGYDDLIIASDEANSGTASTIQFRVDATERMCIDSAGRVTKPYQPSFFASGNQGFQTTASGATIVLDTTSFNVGSHYSTSTGRFTAPVAGKYFVSFTSYTQSIGTMTLKKNGSDFSVTDVAFLYLPNNVSARSGGISGLIHLNANDYIHFGARSNQQVYYYQGHTTFSAFLIG